MEDEYSVGHHSYDHTFIVRAVPGVRTGVTMPLVQPIDQFPTAVLDLRVAADLHIVVLAVPGHDKHGDEGVAQYVLVLAAALNGREQHVALSVLRPHHG